MKQRKKSLTLSRETLITLETLGWARGGCSALRPGPITENTLVCCPSCDPPCGSIEV